MYSTPMIILIRNCLSMIYDYSRNIFLIDFPRRGEGVAELIIKQSREIVLIPADFTTNYATLILFDIVISFPKKKTQ